MKQFALRKNNQHVTYAEYCGEKPIDWYKELKEVKPDTNRLCDLSAMADNWITCACGNACKVIPRNFKENDRPDDPELANLGIDFAHYLTLMDQEDEEKEFEQYRAAAIKVLDQIEARSATLVNEIMKKRAKLPPVEKKQRKGAE